MTFRTDHHGRYDIRSGTLSGAWAANGYRRKTLVAKASGASREEAIDAVKEQLDKLDLIGLSERDDEGAPSAKVYEEAFASLLPSLPDSYVAMLRAHLAAPDHLLSATKLAKAAGYSGYEGANLHYGKLGQRVAEEIGFVPPTRDDGTKVWTCAIARDPGLDTEYPDTSMLDAMMRTMDVPHYEWQMRSQVVQALKALGVSAPLNRVFFAEGR